MPLLKSPREITSLFNSDSEQDNALGYRSFLGRTHWRAGQGPDDLRQFACRQLQIRTHDVLVQGPLALEPGQLWASQDSLDAQKLAMVEAAYRYSEKIQESLPPIIVWNFFQSRQMRNIVHDGHHRAHFAHTRRSRVQAVVLEPVGNYAQVERCFCHAHTIRTRVIDLPIVSDGEE